MNDDAEALAAQLSHALSLLRQWQDAYQHEIAISGRLLPSHIRHLQAVADSTWEYLSQFEEGEDDE